jgi:biotin carboxyl carrier protein
LKLQITIDGRTYAVDVDVLEDDETPQAPGPMPPHATSAPLGGTQGPGAGWDAEGRLCHSPLMGLVIKVGVKPGQKVEADETLLVLEAMKMETKITAPHEGTVKDVLVIEGEPVKQNQLLVELD